MIFLSYSQPVIFQGSYVISKWSEVAQLCPTLCDAMDYSLPGSSVRGILQARILEWVATSFSRGSSQSRDQTRVSCIAGRHFNLWATTEALIIKSVSWFQRMAQHPRYHEQWPLYSPFFGLSPLMISLVFLLLYFKHLYEIFFKNFIGCAMGAW